MSAVIPSGEPSKPRINDPTTSISRRSLIVGGASVTENNTVENMERIFKIAKANGYDVFISPHYFYPTDNGWKFNGPLETEELRTHTFARSGSLNLAGFPNSGADWLDRFKPYIDD